MAEVLINNQLMVVDEVVAQHITHIEGLLGKVHQLLRLEHENWGPKEKQRLNLIAALKKEITKVRPIQKELF